MAQEMVDLRTSILLAPAKIYVFMENSSVRPAWLDQRRFWKMGRIDLQHLVSVRSEKPLTLECASPSIESNLQVLDGVHCLS